MPHMGTVMSRAPFKFWWAPIISPEQLKLDWSNYVHRWQVGYVKSRHMAGKSPLLGASSESSYPFYILGLHYILSITLVAVDVGRSQLWSSSHQQDGLYGILLITRTALHACCAIVVPSATMSVQNYAGSRIKCDSCWKCSSGWHVICLCILYNSRPVFTRAEHSSVRVIAMIACLSVCVSVCVSHAGIVSKRLNVGSRKPHRMIAQGL